MRLGLMWRVATLALIAGVSQTAKAQQEDEARLHFRVAASYYDAGEYENALREFQTTYDISHKAELFYNISRCHENLNRLPEAIAALERYLTEVAEIENRANLERRLENLRERLAAQQAAEQQQEQQQQQQGTQQQGTQQQGTQQQGTQQQGTQQQGTQQQGTQQQRQGTQQTGQPDRTLPPPPPQSRSGGGVSTGAVISFVVGGLGAASMAAFGFLALDKYNKIKETCADGANPDECSEETNPDESDRATYALISDIGLGVAIGGAALGVTLLFVGGGGDEEEAAASSRARFSIAPWVDGHGGAGAVVQGTF